MGMDYRFLLHIALILIFTKVLGLAMKKVHLPQVVGALIAGLILGPILLLLSEHIPSLNYFTILIDSDESTFFTMIAEIGVIVLMFQAGLETNIKELKKVGKNAIIIAICGVIVPIFMGTFLAYIFNSNTSNTSLLQNIFLGIILAATSVSITVEALKDMGKLNTKVGNTILAAALLDDILGLICLTIITGLVGINVSVLVIIFKIVGFFIFAIVSGIAFRYFYNWYCIKIGEKNLRRFSILAFVFCLLMAFSSEFFFGVADIIGAFIAGLVISTTPKAKYIESRFSPLSYLLLSPIFFANIGMKIVFPGFSWALIGFSVSLIIVAIISKIIGCGLAAKACKFNNKESAQIGVGMSCRGEVALIVANKGLTIELLAGTGIMLMANQFLGPVVIMIIFVSIITPILLGLIFRDHHEHHSSGLIDSYNKAKDIDKIASEILKKSNEDIVEAT